MHLTCVERGGGGSSKIVTHTHTFDLSERSLTPPMLADPAHLPIFTNSSVAHQLFVLAYRVPHDMHSNRPPIDSILT
jgi:hypothetical protein